jgi:catechol 2,3-dioxygenase-like lactoylglutathione lyase family enzyme
MAIPSINIALSGTLTASGQTLFWAPFQQGGRVIRGIKFVGIPVRNQDISLKFYTEKLGFKVATDQPFTEAQRWIELLIPGAESGLSLFTPPGHEDRIGEFQPISFWCDDVFATAHILKSKGVTFAQEPKTEVWGSVAVFKDPDGNQFVLSSNGKRR